MSELQIPKTWVYPFSWKIIKHPWNVFTMNRGLQIFRGVGDITIDEEIYLHVWKCYTAQSLHLENIFKRLRDWAHLHSSFPFVLVSTLFPILARSQLLAQPCEKRVDQGFIHHGVLRRVLGKNWVIHHHLFKLRFCSLGLRPGIPAALVTFSTLSKIPQKNSSLFQNLSSVTALYLISMSVSGLWSVQSLCFSIAFMPGAWKTNSKIIVELHTAKITFIRAKVFRLPDTCPSNHTDHKNWVCINLLTTLDSSTKMKTSN